MVRIAHLLATVAVVLQSVVIVAASDSCGASDARFAFCSPAGRSNGGVDVRARQVARTSAVWGNPAPRGHRAGGSRATSGVHCDTLCKYLKTHPDDPSLHRALRATPGSAVVTSPPRPPSATPAVAARTTPARVVTAHDVAHFLAAVGE